MLLTRMKEIAGAQTMDRGARISGPWLTADSWLTSVFSFVNLEN